MNKSNFYPEFKYGNPGGSMHGYNSIASALEDRGIERPLWQRSHRAGMLEQIAGWFRNRRRVSGFGAPASVAQR